MGLLQNIKNIFVKSRYRNLSSWEWEAFMAQDQTVFTIESALKNNYMFAGVRAIVEALASIPINQYQVDSNGQKKQVRFGPIYRMVKRKPNSYQTVEAWKSQIMMHLIFKGNSFLWKGKSADGTVFSLTPLNPDKFKVELINFVKTFKNVDTGTVYTENEILHIAGFTFDGISGVSLLEYQSATIADSNTIRKFSRKYFRNGTFISGYLQAKEKTISADSAEIIKTQWTNRSTSVENAGRVDTLPAEFEYKPLTINAKDAVLIEALGSSLLDVARILKISPHKLGDLTKASYASLEMQDQEFLSYTLLPWIKFIEGALNVGLFPDESQFLEFNIDSFARADLAGRAAAYRDMIQNSVLTPNEARAKENLPPKAGGDELIFNLNQTSGQPQKKTANKIKNEKQGELFE